MIFSLAFICSICRSKCKWVLRVRLSESVRAKVTRRLFLGTIIITRSMTSQCCCSTYRIISRGAGLRIRSSAFSLTILISDPCVGDAKNRFCIDFLDVFYVDFVQRLPCWAINPQEDGQPIKVDGELVLFYYAESIFALRARRSGTRNAQTAGKKNIREKADDSFFVKDAFCPYIQGNPCLCGWSLFSDQRPLLLSRVFYKTFCQE